MTTTIRLFHHHTSSVKEMVFSGFYKSVPCDSTVGIEFQNTPYELEVRRKVLAAFRAAGVTCSDGINSYERIFNDKATNSIWAERPLNLIIHPASLVRAGKALQTIAHYEDIALEIHFQSGYEQELRALLTTTGIKLGVQKAQPSQYFVSTVNTMPKQNDLKSALPGCTMFGAAVGCVATGCNPIGGIKGAIVGAALGGTLDYLTTSPLKPKSPSFSR